LASGSGAFSTERMPPLGDTAWCSSVTSELLKCPGWQYSLSRRFIVAARTERVDAGLHCRRALKTGGEGAEVTCWGEPFQVRAPATGNARSDGETRATDSR